MDFHDLGTPAVLVDLGVASRNVEAMAAAARARGVALRPHAKAHKTAELARLQLAAGACGLCVAKTGEAEAYAEAGFDDLFVAYPVVGPDKARRLLALADRVRLAVGVDSIEGATCLAGAFHAASRVLEVRLKVDVGFHRVGVLPEAALDLALRLAELPGLRLGGVFTHPGHAYLAPTPAALREIALNEGRILGEVAERLRGAGLPAHVVSIGSTPTARDALGVAGVTEARPGVYVFNDASQVALGTCAPGDCALTVLSTIVSVPAPDRAVLDAGGKTLSSDPLRPVQGGHGTIVGRRSRLERLSEEHGVVQVDPGEVFRVGERVRVVPNHACVVANLHDDLVAVRGERVEGRLRVLARGRVD